MPECVCVQRFVQIPFTSDHNRVRGCVSEYTFERMGRGERQQRLRLSCPQVPYPIQEWSCCEFREDAERRADQVARHESGNRAARRKRIRKSALLARYGKDGKLGWVRPSNRST